MQRREIKGAHHDPLVGQADSYAAAELALAKQLAQHVGESVDVDHLAVAYNTRCERHHRGTVNCDLAGAGLDGCDIARLDVEPYDISPCDVCHFS